MVTESSMFNVSNLGSLKTTWVQLLDVLAAIYKDEAFEELFKARGRSAIAPWRLALVTVKQFAKGLSDRQAAEAVRTRVGWKYALSLELTGPDFDLSVLSELGGRGPGVCCSNLFFRRARSAVTSNSLVGGARTLAHVLGALRVSSQLV
jgi:transposase